MGRRRFQGTGLRGFTAVHRRGISCPSRSRIHMNINFNYDLCTRRFIFFFFFTTHDSPTKSTTISMSTASTILVSASTSTVNDTSTFNDTRTREWTHSSRTSPNTGTTTAERFAVDKQQIDNQCGGEQPEPLDDRVNAWLEKIGGAGQRSNNEGEYRENGCLVFVVGWRACQRFVRRKCR